MVIEKNYVVMSSDEFCELKNKEIELRKIIFELIKKHKAEDKDVEVPPREFINLWNMAVTEMFDNDNQGKDENEIYGHDVTVHWHGIQCNLQDGATIENILIPAIEGIIEEADL